MRGTFLVGARGRWLYHRVRSGPLGPRHRRLVHAFEVAEAVACSCGLQACRTIGADRAFSTFPAKDLERESSKPQTILGATARASRPLSTKKVNAVVDPTAKRPTAKCDPYGQGGKPMDATKAKALLSTVHGDWTIVPRSISSNEDQTDSDLSGLSAIPLPSQTPNERRKSAGDSENDADSIPLCLVREFFHPDFASAGRFAAVVSALSEIQAHYPRMVNLERRVVKKHWVVSTTVTCQTQVLEGLSVNDFHLAMVRRNFQWSRFLQGEKIQPHDVASLATQMIDVEVGRPEVRKLLLHPDR